MKKMITMLSLAGMFTMLCGSTCVFAQSAYELEIVAQTGVTVGAGTPIALGQEPSINDAGKVAFDIRHKNGDPDFGHVFGKVLQGHGFARAGRTRDQPVAVDAFGRQ